MEKDGIPVMQLLDPKDRDYIQNLDQQFQMTYGRKRGAADKNLQGSFVGTIQLMNKSFAPEQSESVARAFLDILFGPGAQMITKNDPARDRDIKFAAVDAMLLGGGGVKPLNLPNGQSLRQEAVKMAMDYADKFNAKKGSAPTTEVAEDAAAEVAAKPDYARQGIKHLYNRLPDGRVSSAEMKNADFLEVAKAIADNGGNLDGLPISLKVDGAGIRFGKDQSGRPFFMTSKVTTPLYQDDVGYFTSFGQQRGQDEENLARTKKYDDALALITGSKFIQALPSDTIVQAEMMYNPMAQQTDQGLKFVNIPYDPKKLGKQMTLVPFVFKQYSTGDERPDADKIKKRLLAASDSNIKIVSNNLEQKGINVSKIINPILNLDPKDKANKPAFDQAKQALSDAIINNPKLAGKDALGDNMEGVVVNMPNGQMFKVTSQQMKSAMAAKMAQPGAKQQGPAKTAVVAVGSFAGHLGHEDLFNATINKAKELGGDPYLFIGNAVGADDPIPTDVKVQTWHKLYPQYAKNISATMQGGSLMQKIKHELISPQPGKPPKYDNIVIMVGEDRKDMPIAGALMKAVNKFPGYEHVKVSLETIPRTRPISFTKLRDVLKNPNATPEQQYAVWAQGFNAQQLGKDWILHLMDITRKGMGIAQQSAAPAIGEMRLFNALMLNENFADGKNPQDKGDSKRHGVPTKASVSTLRKVAKQGGRKGQLAHWMANMKAGKAKKNEEFNGEYDDEAGMAQSNLRTMARAVDGLLKTIKSNDNLPEWGQEKIAKAEMMLVSVWDYLLSQKELGMDPKINESKAVESLRQIVAELSSEKLGQYKKAAGAQASAADKAGDTKKADKRFSGIVKATKKQFANDEKGVAEGSDGWIGNPAKWKEAVLQAHGPDVVFKNYTHPGQPGKRSVNAINTQGKQVGVYQRHNKMGMVQPSQQGVAEGLSKRDQQDVAAIRAAIARLEAQLNHPNADRDAILQSIAHEKKRLALYGQDIAEGTDIQIPTEDGITWQDIRLMAGEGKLTKKTVLQAIAVIRKQRREQGVAEKFDPRKMKSSNDTDVRTVGAGAVRVPSDASREIWNEPTWSFKEIADKLGVSTNTLNLLAWKQIGGFPDARPGLTSKHGSSKYYKQSEVKRWVNANKVRELIKGRVATNQGVAEGGSNTMADTAKRLANKDDGKVAKLRAAGDKRREDQLKSRDIAKKNEAMMPASKFAGSDKNKLGRAGQLKGTAPKEQPTHKLVGETDKKKGVDGKACWKGYKYAGTKNGKDKCVPIGEAYEAEMSAAILKLVEGKI
jgi:hypothetical protein